MLRVLLVWAVCSGAISVAAAAAPVVGHPTREWTDAGGANRAHAAFVRMQGDWVILRRPDGKLAATKLANLSEPDRQYVASLQTPAARPEQAADLESPNATAPLSEPPDTTSTDPVTAVAEGVTEAVETIQELPRWLGESQVAGDDPNASLVPAALVYVRVSREFLEEYVERTVRRRKPVRDCVLGTRIVGESDTRGKTRLTLLPSNEQLTANIVFEGTVRAHTRGYNGPVVLHNVSDSTFTARKLIELDDEMLHVSRATAVAPTRLDTHSITTHLPRLRGRIATRIAWRRTNASHGRAEAITADHTADDIRSDFDERTNRSLANVKRVLGEKIPDLEEGSRSMPTDLRFRCRPEHVEMAILREDATPEERKLRPPPARADSDVSLRVHRTLFISAIADPQLLQDLTPLFEKLLAARPKQEGNGNGASGSTGGKAADAPKPVPKWSMESGWLVMDFEDAGG